MHLIPLMLCIYIHMAGGPWTLTPYAAFSWNYLTLSDERSATKNWRHLCILPMQPVRSTSSKVHHFGSKHQIILMPIATSPSSHYITHHSQMCVGLLLMEQDRQSHTLPEDTSCSTAQCSPQDTSAVRHTQSGKLHEESMEDNIMACSLNRKWDSYMEMLYSSAY